MTIDIKAMLHRVVAEVFDENFAVTNASSSDDSWLHGVHVSNGSDQDRTAIIRASYGWMDAIVPELNVQTILFDEDDVEAEKEAELRRLCFVMRAYLQGEGRVEQRRRLFRRGTVPILSIEVDGLEWRLGRRHSSVPNPSLHFGEWTTPGP
jgi:hypothetical protein